MLFDIDNFKQLNDNYGHQAGDEVLHELAAILKSVSRETDTVVRYGGEEFIIILPNTPEEETVHLANRIRNAVQENVFPLNGGSEKVKITISGGIASYPKNARDAKNLLNAADTALYAAKAAGKNVVLCCEVSIDEKVFGRPDSLKPAPFRYCPGCGHSLIHRLIAECTDHLKIREKVIGIAPVGCAVFAYDYFNFDIIEAAHGRPPAVATALKRVMPDKIIFSYQGDGDLAAIGTSEIIHAANRGENLSVFFVNNANYGMTGGQMAPTTIPGQKTTTLRQGCKDIRLSAPGIRTPRDHRGSLLCPARLRRLV
jgi:diguanylate cyclase (GGDEF)-like protein